MVTPETMLIARNSFGPTRERNQPAPSASTIHQDAEPKNTPSTTSGDRAVDAVGGREQEAEQEAFSEQHGGSASQPPVHLLPVGRECFAEQRLQYFFFRADLEVSLHRILEGRPQLKYFEAGMDLRLSSDPYESFRIFQGRILEHYLAMSTEFDFLMMDANKSVEAQQTIVRDLVGQRLNLEQFNRHGLNPIASPAARHHKFKQEAPEE